MRVDPMRRRVPNRARHFQLFAFDPAVCVDRGTVFGFIDCRSVKSIVELKLKIFVVLIGLTPPRVLRKSFFQRRGAMIR